MSYGMGYTKFYIFTIKLCETMMKVTNVASAS